MEQVPVRPAPEGADGAMSSAFCFSPATVVWSVATVFYRLYFCVVAHNFGSATICSCGCSSSSGGNTSFIFRLMLCAAHPDDFCPLLLILSVALTTLTPPSPKIPTEVFAAHQMNDRRRASCASESPVICLRCSLTVPAAQTSCQSVDVV